MKSDPGFLQAIIDHPEDDTARLIYADWLEDHGDADQAEFIRVQLALARLTEVDECRPQLLGREVYLLARHCKEWGRPVRGLARRWEFRRGCLEGITLPLGRFLRDGEKLFRLAPIRNVQLAGREGNLEDLAACPHLSRVSELTLRNTKGRLGPLVHSPHLRGVRGLRFQNLGHIAETECHELDTLSELETLDLQVGLYPRRHQDLRGDRWPRLRSLRLSAGSLDSRLIDRVIHQLEVLDLSHCGLGLELIAGLLLLPKRTLPLKVLVLAGNPFGLDLGGRPHSRDQGAFFAERLAPNLHALDLRRCSLHRAFAQALVQSPNLSRLTRLNVGFNPLGGQWLQALADSPHLDRLTHLGLARLFDEQSSILSWLELLDTPNLPRLAALDLRYNDLDATAAKVLAATSLPDRLYHLDLRHNRLGNGGAFSLLAAEWPRLAWLDLRDNGLTAQAKEQLRQRFGYTVHY